ncbi:hypothetical protein EHP00_574 [Ecytonucleospora hepatopenaei]|uniref:Spc7 kinetochore protein domain-containing protein n=1 Tax=Ecytonucleospora hepatopenaei TaxID=646526 RepID=A0A1W0E8I8_9MICR|nr:hypothetical protein EHP00_574 [Ecytonucleospora hepatopenaei]
MSDKKEERKKRASFHPSCMKAKDDVEQNDIELHLFETQKFDGNKFIENISKKPKTLRMSIDPLQNLSLTTTNKNNKVEEGDNILHYKEKPKRSNYIDDFMYSQDIRFLDKIIISFDNNQYKNYSRSVDPRNKEWLKKCILPRIEYFKQIIKVLTSQMDKTQNKIEKKQSLINTDKVDVTKLKKLRNESRNKSKYEWYLYRKIQEMNFNKIILENEQKMTLSKAMIENEFSLCESEIKQLEEEKLSIQNELDALNQEINNTEHLIDDDIEDLKYILMEQSSKFELLCEDENNFKKKLFEHDTEKRMCKNRIRDLNVDIETLNCTIVGKNADEDQLELVKKENKLYERIFDMQITCIKPSSFVFNLGNLCFTCDLTNDGFVKEFFVKKTKTNTSFEDSVFDSYFINNFGNLMDSFLVKDGENIIENNKKEDFIKNMLITPKRYRRLSVSNKETENKESLLNTINFENTLDALMLETCNKEFNKNNESVNNCFKRNDTKKIGNFILNLLMKYNMIVLFKKEVNYLKNYCKIDSFYAKGKVYLRLYLNSFKKCLSDIDLNIDENFCLNFNKKKVANLNENLSSLKDFVIGYVENN